MSNNNYNFTPTLDGINNVTGDSITCTELQCDNATINNNLEVGEETKTKDLIATGSINTNTLNVNASTTTNTLSVVGTADVSGNLNVVGTSDLVGNTTIGTPSYALRFQRNGNQAIGDATYSANTQGTIEVWYKNVGTINNTQYIFGVQNSFLIVLTSGNRLCTQDYGAGTNVFRTSTTLITDGLWHHLALVFNLGITNGTKLYYDGLPVLTTTISAGTAGLLFLGNIGTTSATATSGFLDECRIWNVMRTDAEILANYKIKIPATTTGLTGYWLLDEGQGATLANSVSGGPVLTQTGAFWTYGRQTADLNATGELNTTNIKALNLILGEATYTPSVQLKMNGIMNMGDRVNLNTNSRVFNIRDTNGIISIGRYSVSEPGFELRNYNPVDNTLRTDVLFLGGGSVESIRCTFRSPGMGGDYVGWFGYRTLFDFQTPIQANPGVQLTGTQQTARFRDRFTTPVGIIDIVLNPNAGNFSSIIQAGDKTIVSQNSMPLALCCTNAIGGGIRLTSTGNEVGGNTTFTANSNIIQSGTGIISQSGTGTNLLKNIDVTGDINFSGNLTQGGLPYNPPASTIALTSDNSIGNYFIPFTKTTASTSNSLFIDDTTSPFTYNPSTQRLTLDDVGASFSLATSYYGCRGDTTSNYIGINVAPSVSGTRRNVCLGNNNGGGFSSTTNDNVLVGYNCGRVYANSRTTGVGSQALYNASLGLHNTAIGMGADYYIVNGAYNVSVGTESGTIIAGSNTSYNTAVGRQSGNSFRGNYNTALGENAYSVNNGVFNNSTAIGANAQVTASNQVVLGTANESVIIPNTITYQDGTIQRSIYKNDILNDTDIATMCQSRNIYQSTFNLGNATNASLAAFGSATQLFMAINIVKGQSYAGISFYNGTAGTYNTALYGQGLTPARLAYSPPVAITALGWWAHTFQVGGVDTPYVASYTGIAFIGIRTTTASQTLLTLPANTYLNYGVGNPANSTFERRCFTIAVAGDFPSPTYTAGLSVVNNNSLRYAYLWGN